MKKNILVMAMALITMGCCKSGRSSADESEKANITTQTVNTAQKALTEKYGESYQAAIEKGVTHAASLWRQQDGTADDFVAFCTDNFIADPEQKQTFFMRVSRNMEILNGHYNKIVLDLQRPIHQPMGAITPIDEAFAAYSPMAHLNDDLYQNKIAFQIALNFPFYTLKEKEALSKNWNRRDWAYARLGDSFVSRVPASVLQQIAKAQSDAEMYIAGYNIYAGNLLDNQQQPMFPADMVLLSHWNLRDEIKSNYSRLDVGLQKQDMIYQVMLHIVNQTIPASVINNPDVKWNPYQNQVISNGEAKTAEAEANERYQQIINCYKAMQLEDAYSPLKTAIDRAFEGEMEISQPDAEALFVSFLSNPAIKQVGELIRTRLGRDLKPWDIWYDGFKARSGINEDQLNEMTRKLYPDAAAMKADLPNLLMKLGFTHERAGYICDKIEVDPANGSGHAWGASMKGETAHLRTRIGANGMDYKGYNIAIHEFGHNVEQTISLYDVDYYMLQGVPNTAFTEALAFLFQKRDLQLLGIANNDPKKVALDVLDNFWSTYEIMGVSLLDQQTWKWLYAHPNATAAELKDAVVAMATDIWNRYYAPVFGVKDSPILAIYSHMVNSPIYLSNYAFGHLIQFQVEQYLQNAQFATEVQRLFALGKLTPGEWMMKGLGEPISINVLIAEADKAVNAVAL